MYLEYLKKSMNQLISTDLHRRTATISSPANGISSKMNDLFLEVENEAIINAKELIRDTENQ